MSVASLSKARRRLSARVYALLLCAGALCSGLFTPLLAQERVLVDAVMTEGTNMAAAVSPDGRTLILALQGVLWSLPATGGDARALTPPEMDAQEPVWAPDGSRIAFYGFIGDAFAIWSMNPDGTDLTRLANGASADARYPAFTPDSRQILYSSDEDGGYAVWMTDRSSGERRPLTSARETGYLPPTTPYFSGDGNAVYPTLSPYGNNLAWVIDGPENRLVVRDLNARQGFREVLRAPVLGAPLWAADGNALYIVGIDGRNTYLAYVPLDGLGATHLVEGGDIFPFRPSLGPDGTLYYTADGQVKTLNPAGEPGRFVPFSAKVTLDRTPYTRRSYDFMDQTPQKALGIIDPILSPDGSQAAFAALGDLWHADFATGVTRQLTDDVAIDISPSWSPDGERLAWVSDRDGIANIWVMTLSDGSSARVTNVDKPASAPVWSPDGSKIAYLKDEGNSVFVSSVVNVLDLASGDDRVISEPMFGPSTPAWSPDGSKVVVSHRDPGNSRFREGFNTLYVLPASGTGEKFFVAPVPGKSLGRRQHNRPAWSSQGEMVYRIDGALWSVPMTASGELGEATLIATAGENPSWSADGRKLIFMDGAAIKLFDKSTGETRDLDIQPTWVQVRPSESMTIRAGRMFDGVNDGTTSSVDIVIQNGVIVDIRMAGFSQAVGTFIDASDKFVMPGLIENHTHQSITQGVMLGELYLCNAITTVRETGDDPYHAVERREAEAAGRRPGPRVFTAGPLNEGTRISYGVSETVESAERVADSLRLSSALKLDMYKSYVRQDYTAQKQVIELAHASGIPVSSHELYPAVANGIDQMEHLAATSRRGYSLKESRLNIAYQDVIELTTKSRVIITPTMALSERGSNLDAQKATLLKIINGGGRIVAGTDSPFVSFADSLHRELEIYVEAGLTTSQALRAATGDAADALGAGNQLGKIARGYLADLVILDGNAIEDISQVRAIHTVIKNGAVACTNPQ